MRIRVLLVLFALTAAACGGSGGGGGAGVADPATIDVDGVTLVGADVERDTAPDATDAELAATAEATMAFALDVYRSVAAQREDKNLVLSPYSLYRLLAMIDAGAAGSTSEEIRRVLHSELTSDRLAEALNRLNREILGRRNDKLELQVADATWTSPSLTPGRPFVEVLAREFGAPLAQLDFGDPAKAKAAIDEWGRKATGGLIEESVPPGVITPLTKLVLADAVYLDAAWEDPFDPKSTSDDDFTRSDGTTVSTPMMRDDGSAPRVYTTEYGAVRLPYAGKGLSMLAVVPQQQPLPQFVTALTPARVQGILGGIEDDGIHLSFPKYKARSQLSLAATLSALGMPTAFSGDADLSCIGAGLHLDAVEQAAYVEVDEKGTKAAAVTSGLVAGSHGPTIAFDRPFLYLILDDATGTVLFIGHVADPTATE